KITMKNNKPLRLARTKKPQRSSTRASCAALVNALFWKILVTRVKHFVARNPAFVSRAPRSASATSGALQTPISGLPEIGALSWPKSDKSDFGWERGGVRG